MDRTRELELTRAIVPLDASGRAYDRLLEKIGDARFVLLGEATHGTHEFYRERAAITERLILTKGFDAVAVEADWPDATRVRRFIHGDSSDRSAEDALHVFQRFPTWMWRNRDVAEFVDWLHSNAPGIGFYGLDLYSLHASIEVVLAWLDDVDPAAARRARDRYSCFELFRHDSDTYGYAAGLGLTPSCEDAVTQQLVEMHEILYERGKQVGPGDELFFEVDMNARLVKAAERYYRSMLQGSRITWNLRDRHMVETLAAIADHLDRRLRRPSKIVVWEHNSHVGDARATEMGAAGEVNVGQLARERWGKDVFNVGFTTYDGMVTAAPDWGAKAVRIAVRPAIPDSHELHLHFAVEGIGVENAVILPNDERRLPNVLGTERLERAIGVVYRPQTERVSHWFRAQLADQFDAIVHIDRTTAVAPLERKETKESQDLPDTYPFAV
jgi:erythromycin esterase-like protein